MAGLNHAAAMKLRYNRATLHLLPEPGVQWQWSDVVDAGDDAKVDPADAHAAKPLLDRHDEGVYETTRDLAEYLDSKYDIEVGGSSVGQARLPIEATDVPSVGSRALTEGHGGTDVHGTTRQVTLAGSDATVDLARLDAARGVNPDVGVRKTPTTKHVKAAHDDQQVELSALQELTQVLRYTVVVYQELSYRL